MVNFKLGLPLIIGLAVSACANQPMAIHHGMHPDEIGAQLDLSDAAVASAKAQSTLAAHVANAKAHQLLEPQHVNLLQHGMGRLVTIDWTGPIEPVLKNVAELSSYHLKVVGEQPAIPIFLNLSRENISLRDLVMEVRNASKARAEVTVDVASKTLQLRYFSM